MSSVERDIFSELFWKIRNLKYVPQEMEMNELRSCEAEAYRRAGISSTLAAGAAIGISMAGGIFQKRKGASIGFALCGAAVAGYYGARSTSSYCLQRLAMLETPMGGELAVIAARRCPSCEIARISPWADAIRAHHANSSGLEQQTGDGVYVELGVSPRIATPEAISALKEERRIANQQAAERRPPVSRRHAAREAAMEAKASAIAGKGTTANSDVFDIVFSHGIGQDQHAEGSEFREKQPQHQASYVSSSSAAGLQPVNHRRRRAAQEDTYGSTVILDDTQNPIPARRRRRSASGLADGSPEDGDMYDPWAAPSRESQKRPF